MRQDANTPFVQIGQVVRSQGLNGELKVFFENPALSAVEELEMLYLRNDRGDFFPARIKQTRVEGKGNKLSFFVQFEHIADRTSAEALKNRALFLEKEKASGFLVSEEIDSFIDFDVYDEAGEHIGIITDELECPAQITLVIASPLHGNLLVPYVDQYVLRVEKDDERVICQNLDLLTDL